MKCSHCQAVLSTETSGTSGCPVCGVPLTSDMDGQSADVLAPESHRHTYVTPFGRHVAQRRKCGNWAVGYQLQSVEGRSAEFREAFSRLENSLSAVQHPSLPSLHSLDELHLRLVWQLPNLTGLRPLSRFDNPLPSAAVAVLVRDLATALSALHQLGHGAFDLSPELIFVTAEFDLTVLVPTPTFALQANATPHIVDSMAFAAPELLESQAQDVEADPVRADIYSLGALAWYLLTATQRYQLPTGLLSEHDPDLKDWDEFIDGCCRTTPQRRFRSVDEALKSLQVVVNAVDGSDADRELPARHDPRNQIELNRAAVSIRPGPVVPSPLRAVKNWVIAILFLIAIVGAYLRRNEIGSAIPGASGLISNYQRGFGDTILRYADRTYDGAKWERLKEIEAIREAAKPGRLFFTDVNGWDSQNFYVTAVTPAFGYAAIYRQHDGQWDVFAQISDATINGDGADVRLLERDTVFAALGYHECEFYRMTPGQRQLYGKSTVPQNYGFDPLRGGIHVSLIDSDLAQVHHGMEYQAALYEVSNGQLRLLDPEKHKRAYVHEENNIPIKEHRAARIHHTRSIQPGQVIGLTRDSVSVQNPHLVEFRSGTWYEIVELPRIDSAPRDLWLIADGTRPRSASYISDKGRIFHYRWNGPSSEQTVSVPTEATSLDLLRIWGVSLDKFWVLDTNGTVWEWGNGHWRNVVRGMRENDVEFTDAWVSPTGSIIAINRDEIYRLN